MAVRPHSHRFFEAFLLNFSLVAAPVLMGVISPAVVRSETVSTVCESFSSESEVYTADTVCKNGLTRPSLWWIREQLGSQLGKKLIRNWIATPGTETSSGQVVVVVNPQAWSLLDYFSRYEFIHAFGLAASDFGYQTEVRDNRGAKLASYRCGDSAERGDRCTIEFGGSGSGFRGERRSPF